MEKGDTIMEKKFSGAPGMVSPAYTSPVSSCGQNQWSDMGYGTGKMVSPASYGTSMGGYPTNVSPAAMGGYPTGYGTSMGGYPAGYGSTMGGYPTNVGPTSVAPTSVLPASVSPTKNIVQSNVFKTIVPHVHPTHKTTVNQHVFQHQHYFPCTQSTVNTCCNQQMICCGPVPQPTTFCPPRPYCC